MKRREFSLSTASAIAATALTLPVATSALAQARQFKDGKDYKRKSGGDRVLLVQLRALQRL